MIKVKVERSPFLLGIGLYVSKKTWNITNKGTWFGPSFVIHIFNRMIRVFWITAEKQVEHLTEIPTS
jgi:hypothetical protein